MIKTAAAILALSIGLAGCSGSWIPDADTVGASSRNAANAVLGVITAESETIPPATPAPNGLDRTSPEITPAGLLPPPGDVAFHGTAANMMTEGDRIRAARATIKALENPRSGIDVGWTNPVTAASGTVRVRGEIYSPAGERCRELLRSVQVDGYAARDVGVACRLIDGSWRLQ